MSQRGDSGMNMRIRKHQHDGAAWSNEGMRHDQDDVNASV